MKARSTSLLSDCGAFAGVLVAGKTGFTDVSRELFAVWKGKRSKNMAITLAMRCFIAGVPRATPYGVVEGVSDQL